MCLSSSWSRPKKNPTVRVTSTTKSKTKKADIPISLLANIQPSYKLPPPSQHHGPPSSASYDSQVRDRNRELQEERERQHESVMGEVHFVHSLKEKLAPPPPPPPPPTPVIHDTKESGQPKPSETETRMIAEMGKLVNMVGKREREDEIERAVRRGREEGVREGRVLAGLGMICGGGGDGASMGGWAAHFAANPRAREYDAYIPQQRRRSSVSETVRNVANRIMDRMDRVGDRLSRDIERVDDRARGVERGMYEFERERNARDMQREREMERERTVERQADRYPPFGRRWT